MAPWRMAKFSAPGFLDAYRKSWSLSMAGKDGKAIIADRNDGK
jgi:hypothetical protein